MGFNFGLFKEFSFIVNYYSANQVYLFGQQRFKIVFEHEIHII